MTKPETSGLRALGRWRARQADFDDLPVDPDPIDDSESDPDEPTVPQHRPAHMRPGLVAVVAAGGMVGTALREGVSLVVPSVADLPVAIVTVNVVGAFLLGVLLEVLHRLGPDRGGRRVVRLLLGTGVLGGFTTYSTFALDIVRLLDAGAVARAVAFAVGTAVLGVMATWSGITVAARLHAHAGRLTRLAGSGEGA
ncbi:fluoride efflux transporter FluC [Aestuariimicrobium kwangyangense]|uniref:fluoride efflux transporter FluC n=1 Tax=Aestuariimicrobium kwangyangense TaxID=396389 RepID=UPI0003B44DAD|nr:CrcB family protein [Aestuariimicrobium kwangyangense]